jgi:hypothetical protein
MCRRRIALTETVQIGRGCSSQNLDNVPPEEQHAFPRLGIERLEDCGRIKPRQSIWTIRKVAHIAEKLRNTDPANPA